MKTLKYLLIGALLLLVACHAEAQITRSKIGGFKQTTIAKNSVHFAYVDTLIQFGNSTIVIIKLKNGKCKRYYYKDSPNLSIDYMEVFIQK